MITATVLLAVLAAACAARWVLNQIGETDE